MLNNLTAWAVATGKVLIKSDGTPWRPIVHVEDITRAFVAALRAPREAIHAQAFNVARPTENYRIRELAQIVRETVPGCTIEFAGDASPDTRNYRVNASKIASILPEFTPVWTARQGAEQLYEAFKEVGITLDEFEGLEVPAHRPDQAAHGERTAGSRSALDVTTSTAGGSCSVVLPHLFAVSGDAAAPVSSSRR